MNTKTISTDVKCPVCQKADIVAETGRDTDVNIMDIPVGESVKLYPRVYSFHCPSCGVLFHHPPGKPNLAEEILSKMREGSSPE